MLAIGKLSAFVRLFITSRPHLCLETKFRGLTRVELRAREEDIQSYLEAELETNDRLHDLTADNPKLRAEITSRVNEKAAGM